MQKVIFFILVLSSSFTKCVLNLYDIFKKTDINTELEPCSKQDNLDERNYYQIYLDELKKEQSITDYAKRQILLEILKNNNYLLIKEPILDEKTINDLEILEQNNLKNFFNSTFLQIGQLMLKKKILSPTDNLEVLSAEQDLLKSVIGDNSLIEQSIKELEILKKHEGTVLSFWNDDSFLDNQLHYYLIKIPGAKKIECLKNLSAKLNNSPTALEINDKLTLSNNFIINAVSLAGACILPVYALSILFDNSQKENLQKITEKLGVESSSIYSIPGALSYALNFCFQNKYIKAASYLISGLSLAKDAWDYRFTIKDHLTYQKCLHTKLSSFAEHMKSSLNLLGLFAKNTNFGKWLKNHGHEITSVYRQITKIKNKLDNISDAGKIYTAYKSVYENKSDYVDLLSLTGHIDALVTTAIAFKNNQDKLCLPKFVINQNPFINLENFRNPVLNLQTAIENSIAIGGSATPNILVTGPNSGGKSTIAAKGIPLAVIMAQSLGITAAKSLSFTPFNIIRTSVKTFDNTSSGKSLFQAGAQRCQELLSLCQNTKNNCLISIDEILGGTSTEESAAAAFALLEAIGKNSNTICVATTHYPILTELKKETGKFENYKVEIKQDNKKISRDYKLKPGTSNQNSAFDILRESGFSGMFLKRAKEILLKLKNKIWEAPHEQHKTFIRS